MATPSGTIVLNEDAVLLENATAGISGIGLGAVGKVVSVGSSVTIFAADDIVLYDKNYVLNLKEGGNTFQAIDQQYILLKYTAAP